MHISWDVLLLFLSNISWYISPLMTMNIFVFRLIIIKSEARSNRIYGLVMKQLYGSWNNGIRCVSLYFMEQIMHECIMTLGLMSWKMVRYDFHMLNKPAFSFTILVTATPKTIQNVFLFTLFGHLKLKNGGAQPDSSIWFRQSTFCHLLYQKQHWSLCRNQLKH